MIKQNKILLVALAFGVLFTACSKKNVAEVKPYESFYTNQSSKKKIVFNGVKDERLLPIVSHILKNDKVVAKFQINQDVKSWYDDAYLREFHAAELILDQQQSDKKSTIVQINLKELKAEYFKDILTEQNLKGVVSLEIVLQKNNKIVKKLINTTLSEYKVSIRDSAGFEKFLYSLMSDSISKSVNIIIETMNSL